MVRRAGVSADDFVYGLRHALTPATASPNAQYLFAIRNARAVFAGKMTTDALGVSRDGDDLVIHLGEPDPILPLELTLPSAAPLRKDAFERSKLRWNFRLPVTGDYVIRDDRPGDRIELAPNPFATHSGKTNIIYKILPEELTALNLFESGRLDVVSTVTISEMPRLKADGLLQIFPSTTVFYLSFNVDKEPFNDPTWRRAIAGAVDREGLAKVLAGGFVPATGYLPPTIAGGTPILASNPQTDAVAKVLSTVKKPRIRLAYGASGFTRLVSEKLLRDFSVKLGLHVELEPMELKTLLARLRSDPPEMYLLGMSATFNDPATQLNSFSSATLPNFSRYKSEPYERILADLKSAGAPEKRTALAAEGNRLLVEKDVVVVPLLLRLQAYAVSRAIKGFSLNPFQVIQLNEITRTNSP